MNTARHREQEGPFTPPVGLAQMVSKIARPPGDVRWRRNKDEEEDAATAGEDGVALRRSQRCSHRPTFMISDILREDFARPSHVKGTAAAAGFAVEDILRLPQCDAPPPAGPPETSPPTAAMASSAPPPPTRVPELPAWIFCTRYSDRPSSGERRRVLYVVVYKRETPSRKRGRV